MTKELDELFANDLGCICYEQSGKKQKFPCCFCGPTERFIRHRAYGNQFLGEALNDEQRCYIVWEADRCGEGMYRREDLEAMDDRDLCRAYISAVNAYVQSQL